MVKTFYSPHDLRLSKYPFRNNSFHIKILNYGPVKEASEVDEKVTLMAFINRPSSEGQTAWWGGNIGASNCSNRCCSVSCKKQVVGQPLLSSTPI